MMGALVTWLEGGLRKHRKLVIVLGVVVAVLVVVGIWVGIAVNRRMAQERAGIGAVTAPSAPAAIGGSSEKTGAFTAEVAYTAMNAPKDACVATTVSWNDDWFFEDPTVYNHELARTCAVLSAIANSESAYYQAGSGAPAYMEDALAALGFESVSTASYGYRSEILDEVIDFFTRDDDVVAYSVASKHITDSATGKSKVLLLVSVRGSYGAEWVSDANMGDPAALDLVQADHEGFADAATEIVDALAEQRNELADEAVTEDIALLFCGHSRGAATANLAASYADDMTTSLRPLANLDSIYAYTFATPTVTTMGNTSDALYDNIFNILNPSDMVPRLPLAAWGFARYGRDLWLPEPGVEGFDDEFAAMEKRYRANVGADNPSVPTDAARVDKLERDLGEQIATKDDFTTAGGIASTVKDLATDVNAVQVLCSHYPNAYIAWMQAIDADALRADR